MKKIKNLFLIVFLLFLVQENRAQVGVNILTPHKTAAFQVETPAGTFRGLLTPTMTSTNRNSIASGTIIPADGLMVYDKDHRMHYFYNGSTNRWNSMSPLTLSTHSTNSSNFPLGTITTPNSAATFSLGINTQNPTAVLDVIGNATVSGNVNVGGSQTVTGNASVTGSVMVAGFPPNALVPQGVIVMFSGTVIPLGWALCDGGTYGGFTTPDLRGRFIVGANNTPGVTQPAGNYIMAGASGINPSNAPTDGATQNYGTIGNTGGETGHTLSLAEMPNHTHSVTAAVVNSNVFGFNLGFNNVSIGNGTAASGDPQTITVNISENARGSNQIHENRPPYYVLAYIIKLP